MSIPEQQLTLDNLCAEVRILMADVSADRQQRELIAARLERIERALAIPLTYSLKQSCSRIGISVRLSYNRPELLPAPCSRKPLRYRVEDVEAMVSQKPRGRERAAS